MSASKMRAFAQDNDLKSFEKVYLILSVEKLFKDVRKGMNLYLHIQRV